MTSVRVAVTNLQDVALAPGERRAQAQLALQELDRLTRLFQDILDMARIDAAAVNPDRQWVSPADVVDAAIAHIGPALAEHTLQIDADGLTRGPDRSSFDVDSPRPRARERRAVLAERCADRRARLDGDATARISSCGTTGQASTPSDLDHLFEPFYRGPENEARDRHRAGARDHPRVAGGRRRPDLVRERACRRRAVHDHGAVTRARRSTRRRRSHAVTRADRRRRAIDSRHHGAVASLTRVRGVHGDVREGLPGERRTGRSRPHHAGSRVAGHGRRRSVPAAAGRTLDADHRAVGARRERPTRSARSTPAPTTT